MDAHFFIRRPRSAGVVSLVVVLAGAMSLKRLPVAEYPDVAPPMVWAMASYPGATAKTVADTVAAPIEDQINNLDGLLYFSGECSNDGGYSLSATFRHGTDADMALVNVNNALKLVESSLPQAVARGGLEAEKRSPGMLGVIAVRSPSMSDLELSNWADRHVIDELRRVEGVGKVSNEMAADWAMRVWLDPERMAALGVSPADVRAAIESQNEEAAAGSVGTEYADGEMTFKIAAKGRLATREEFEGIVVRAGDDPVRRVRLGDVARVELGAQAYQGTSRFQGDGAVAVSVYKATGANSLKVMEAVKRRMGEIEALMPEGMRWDMAYDSTTFVGASMREIAWTILLTFLLVVGITWLFLGSRRATLIPALAIPVSLVGTFAFLDAFGMSVNTLTMFGFVLVIGSVVDNAICVTESCVRLLAEGRSRAGQRPHRHRALSPRRLLTYVENAHTMRFYKCRKRRPHAQTHQMPQNRADAALPQLFVRRRAIRRERADDGGRVRDPAPPGRRRPHAGSLRGPDERRPYHRHGDLRQREAEDREVPRPWPPLADRGRML